jgi:iron(III) transport system permease protein
VAVVLPTVALVAASITRAVGLPPTPANWTLDNYRAALSGTTLVALRRSIELALIAAVALVVLGSVVAVLEHHRGGRAFATVSAGAFAVPGSALAVGVLIAYDRRLGGTLAIILIAYLAKFWALSHRTVSGAMERLPPDEWRAARTSGAGVAAAVRTIWLPGMARALIGAGVLVFIASLHEVTMSSLLYSTGSETFAVTVLNSQQLGGVPTTAALSVILTAVILAIVLVAAVLLGIVGPRAAGPARGHRLSRFVHVG